MSQSARAAKAAAQRFSLLMDQRDLHIRVPDRTRDVAVYLIGTARELHGPGGRCTCCPRADASEARRLPGRRASRWMTHQGTVNHLPERYGTPLGVSATQPERQPRG